MASTKRSSLQQCMDQNVDTERLLRRYAAFADSVHLRNVQVQAGDMQTSHYSALPGLDPADGWAQNASYMKIIRPVLPIH